MFGDNPEIFGTGSREKQAGIYLVVDALPVHRLTRAKWTQEGAVAPSTEWFTCAVGRRDWNMGTTVFSSYLV